jgi:predicted secreted protein
MINFNPKKIPVYLLAILTLLKAIFMKLRPFSRLCFGILVCAALTPACAKVDTAAPNTISPTQVSNPSQSIVVEKSNPQFSITLASNRTTGYAWQLLDYDKQLLTLAKHTYIKPVNAMPGAGGKEIWIFKVNDAAFTTPQTMQVNLLYARPWNVKDNSKHVVFTVKTH